MGKVLNGKIIANETEMQAEIKRLDGKIDSKPNTPVVDSLTSDRTDAALSANQGKVLKTQLDAKPNTADVLLAKNLKHGYPGTTNTDHVCSAKYADSLYTSKADKTDLTNLTKRVDALETKKPYEIVANAEASKSKPGVLCLVKET